MTRDTKQSVDWFIGKARSATGYRKNIIENDDRARDTTVIGKMFFFYYDPKHKDKLPVYDRFPLVFPIERYDDGFLGLNLHYLSASERSAFLGTVMTVRNNQKMNETTKLRISYDIISSSRKFASFARPCIKRYLFGHVRSKFIEITADEWERAINLPVQIFVTQS